MNKGQVFSGDFLISIIVFIVVLGIILPLFGQLSERMHNVNEQHDLEARALFVSEALIRTGGYPENWNASSVLTVGFSDNHGMNTTKISSFLNMSYEDAQNALALNGVNFNISFTDIDGYSVYTGVSILPVAYFFADSNVAQSALSDSAVVWDMYYAGSGSAPQSNARNIYTGEKAALFNEMLGNQSAYKTIIVEDPDLTQGEVDVQALRNFLRTGGLLIFIGDAELLSSGFSVTAAQQSSENGVVISPGFIDAQIGETVNFVESEWYIAGSDVDVIVGSVSNNSRALIGSWSYGSGKIFYITSLNGAVNGNNLVNLLNIVGKKIEYGTALPEKGTVIIAKRSAIVEKHIAQFVSVRFLLWV